MGNCDEESSARGLSESENTGDAVWRFSSSEIPPRLNSSAVLQLVRRPVIVCHVVAHYLGDSKTARDG